MSTDRNLEHVWREADVHSKPLVFAQVALASRVLERYVIAAAILLQRGWLEVRRNGTWRGRRSRGLAYAKGNVGY
jgi:hypothetical protein